TGIVKTPVESPFKKSLSQDRDLLRETWSGRYDFLLSCIGFAVGLGNIWRFPYLCFENGGVAFLIPYMFFMVTCALPLFYLEVACGQFASLGVIAIWRICPLLRGIGYGMIIVASLVTAYFSVLLAWNFYFIFQSMSATLPWTECGQSWNTHNCFVGKIKVNGTEGIANRVKRLATEEFMAHNVLEKTSGIEHFGTIRWPLLGCLLLVWVSVFLCLFHGIKYTGKIVYVTATFPYLIMMILLIREASLPGASRGINEYIIPKWGKLIRFHAWGDAAVQIFFSMGMAWGSLINMASYNKFNHNFYREVIIVPVVNFVTSIFAGFFVFCTLGIVYEKTDVCIEELINLGSDFFAFVIFPEAVSLLRIPQAWALMFFLMLFFVGLDTQFAYFGMITDAFIDEYPEILRKRKALFTGVCCLIAFIFGIPLVFQGSTYLIQIIGSYAAGFTLMLLSVMECVVVCWIYGDQRFARDIELMLGETPGYWWMMMWKYFTPLLVGYTWAFFVGDLKPETHGKDNVFPEWAKTMGWGFGLVSLVPLPVYAVIAIRRETTGSIWQRIKKLTQPAFNWGPALVENRVRYLRSMSRYDRERFESAFFDMDRARYLSLRKPLSLDTTQSIDINPVYGVRKTGLPLGAAVPLRMPDSKSSAQV
ncbi:unnamed protein product, partial [Candidula unifasciata]